ITQSTIGAVYENELDEMIRRWCEKREKDHQLEWYWDNVSHGNYVEKIEGLEVERIENDKVSVVESCQKSVNKEHASESYSKILEKDLKQVKEEDKRLVFDPEKFIESNNIISDLQYDEVDTKSIPIELGSERDATELGNANKKNNFNIDNGNVENAGEIKRSNIKKKHIQTISDKSTVVDLKGNILPDLGRKYQNGDNNKKSIDAIKEKDVNVDKQTEKANISRVECMKMVKILIQEELKEGFDLGARYQGDNSGGRMKKELNDSRLIDINIETRKITFNKYAIP
ncbi:7985_t:CDS:2, partial [Gigaspora rosea]